MDRNKKYKHRDCYFCKNGGYLFSKYVSVPEESSASMTIEKKHEGWPGIPHGGVGMTAIIELSDKQSGITSRHPWKAKFRFGGEKLELMDEVSIKVRCTNRYCNAIMQTKSGRAPYLTGRLEEENQDEIKDELEDLLNIIKSPIKSRNPFEIPVFSNRIIFKEEFQRLYPTRVFEWRETLGGIPYMASFYRKNNGLIPCRHMNTLTKDSVHPGAIVSLLDETLGWAGFLAAWQGGITVELNVHFLNKISCNDSIFSVSYCTGIKGSHRRKMTSCAGGIIAIKGDSYIPAVYCTGRWLTRPEYKEKMLKYIVPQSTILASLIHKRLNQ